MAFDGVFAFQGKDHITASQLGRIVEGVAGKGRYVLPTLNQMTAEMQTANKVRVGTGDLVMDGRVVTNEAAVDLTVESGTSGYKRNDLVVCRYTKNASTGVENFAAEVVKGTPTTGTAADPKVTEGDISSGSASAVMPLWRIPLNGITPGAPVRIAPVASTLRALGDSVSQRKVACGSIVVSKGANIFWDLMSFETAARYLGCSVSAFRVESTGVENLFCFVCSGDSVNAIGPTIAEFDTSRRQVRLRFTDATPHTFRANWMLVLSEQ